MKNIRIVALVSLAVLAVVGAIMAVTNPSQSEYEEYATQKLMDYLKNDACSKVPKAVEGLFKRSCPEQVDANRSQLQKIITESTEQQNFIFFSIYRTDLSFTRISPFLTFLPSYHAETVGAVKNFFIYSGEKR